MAKNNKNSIPVINNITNKKIHTKNKGLKIFLIVLAILLSLIFLVFPLLFSSTEEGNVALIKVEGVIMGSSSDSLFGSQTASSQTIVNYIEQASDNPSIEAIVIEINSPGGSAVASDEIAAAILATNKPTVAVIREVGASGGYWVASSTDYVVSNRMSITGSVGVIASYLEFSGLMDKYGVEYQRMVAGERKDLGSPYRDLTSEEEEILQSKLDLIHDYFIQAVARNRNLEESQVRQLATGEFYLGVEALNLGLVDELGDLSTAENYLKENYELEKIEYYNYEPEVGLFDILGSIFNDFSFGVGEGLGSALIKEDSSLTIFT